MDKLVRYRQYVQDILRSHVDENDSPVTTQVLFDTERDHYQLAHVGWADSFDRVYGILVHVDIIGDKIWIQRDKTEIGVATELIDYGVDKKDIVLGFQSPHKRQFTEFAVG